jgi:hypothetical protein
MINLRKFTPVVDKKILIILPGIMWCGVGVMLVSFAVSWLSVYSWDVQLCYFLAGFIAAMPIHHFGFLKIVDKNLKRLLPLTEKRCVFSFMTLKSYFTVLIMVAMGIALRHSSFPKRYLSVLYNGIGLALFLSGIRYFRFFFKLLNAKGLEI